jgi:hypothetical protein
MFPESSFESFHSTPTSGKVGLCVGIDRDTDCVSPLIGSYFRIDSFLMAEAPGSSAKSGNSPSLTRPIPTFLAGSGVGNCLWKKCSLSEAKTRAFGEVSWQISRQRSMSLAKSGGRAACRFPRADFGAHQGVLVNPLSDLDHPLIYLAPSEGKNLPRTQTDQDGQQEDYSFSDV